MNRSRSLFPALTLLATLCAGRTLAAQAAGPLAVGTQAPDFTLPGAASAGLLAQPVHLADLRGQTVVLAFFYKARTKG